MGEVFGLIYAIIKAIPIADKAVRDFLVFYAVKQKEWYAQEIKAAIEKAIATGDTTDLESAIGSPQAGKPSGQNGVEYSDPSKP